jgi:hypothetical protein
MDFLFGKKSGIFGFGGICKEGEYFLLCGIRKIEKSQTDGHNNDEGDESEAAFVHKIKN